MNAARRDRVVTDLADARERGQAAFLAEQTHLNLGENREVGRIAQEVEQAIPEMVGVSNNGFKGVHDERLPLLVLQGVQELKQREDAEAVKLRQLEFENRELKARLERLEKALLSKPARR